LFVEKHGILSPHEPNPETLSPEEYQELSGNLRRQWISGKLPTKDYRARMAELPLPESSSSFSSEKAEIPVPERPSKAVPEEVEEPEAPMAEGARQRVEGPPEAPPARLQQKLKAAFGSDAETFAKLLGAISARTSVQQSFAQALDVYDQLKSGTFDRHIQKYLEAHDHLARGEGALAKHMHDFGIVDERPRSDAAAMAAWIAHHDILPRRKNGEKLRANANQVLKVLAAPESKLQEDRVKLWPSKSKR
jgi:hypothetical protein